MLVPVRLYMSIGPLPGAYRTVKVQGAGWVFSLPAGPTPLPPYPPYPPRTQKCAKKRYFFQKSPPILNFAVLGMSPSQKDLSLI